MPSPDARPVGEAEAETGERTEHMSMKAATARRRCTEWLPERDHEAYPHAIAALDAYRDAVAAEARAALLAGAPAVWVARDDDGIGWVFDTPPQKDRDGDWDVPDVHDKQWALNGMMNMPPGTCVRYRLVPDTEETP